MSSSSYFKHQSLTRACNRGCEPTNERTNERTNEEHVSNSSDRCSLASSAQYRSRNAPTTTTHHIFDAYRRCRSGNARVKFYDPRKILESSDKNTNTMASEKGLHVADLLEAPGLTSTLR